MSDYLNRVLEQVNAKDSNEPEFLQAVKEVLTTIKPMLFMLRVTITLWLSVSSILPKDIDRKVG